MLLQPCAQAALVERVATWQLAALASICTDFLEADVAVGLFALLHRRQALEELFADSASLWLLLSVSEDEEAWHACALHHARERMSALAKVHVDVVHVVNVHSAGLPTEIAGEGLHLWLIHASSIRDGH